MAVAAAAGATGCSLFTATPSGTELVVLENAAPRPLVAFRWQEEGAGADLELARRRLARHLAEPSGGALFAAPAAVAVDHSPVELATLPAPEGCRWVREGVGPASQVAVESPLGRLLLARVDDGEDLTSADLAGAFVLEHGGEFALRLVPRDDRRRAFERFFALAAAGDSAAAGAGASAGDRPGASLLWIEGDRVIARIAAGAAGGTPSGEVLLVGLAADDPAVRALLDATSPLGSGGS